MDNNGSIYQYTEKGTEVFDNNQNMNYITCNSRYLYTADKESLFQYDFDGKLIKSINSNSCDSIYAQINGIYATDKCVFCKLGGSSYLLVDPTSLETISINDVLEKAKWKTVDNVQIACGNNIKMVSSTLPVDANKCYFDGTICYNDNCINPGIEGIIGLSNSGCIEYHSFNDTVLKNLYNDVEYSIELTDIRHIFLDDELLIAFNSDYNDSSFFKKFCFITDEYSARDVGFYDELPLTFHKGDKINIINIKNGNKKNIKTKSGEKIISLNNKTVVTYYKEQYHFYNIDTWNCYKSVNAEEIDNHSTYRFETCGNYIFVFDDNYNKLLNTIDIR